MLGGGGWSGSRGRLQRMSNGAGRVVGGGGVGGGGADVSLR